MPLLPLALLLLLPLAIGRPLLASCWCGGDAPMTADGMAGPVVDAVGAPSLSSSSTTPASASRPELAKVSLDPIEAERDLM